MTEKKNTARRGPSPKVRSAVLCAVRDLLHGEGLEAVTVQRIHERTQIARTTIYRHWPQRIDLVRLLLEKATFPDYENELTGDVRHDLDEAMKLLLFRFRHRPVRHLLITLLECGRTSPETVGLGQEYIAGLLHPFYEVIGNAVASGRLRAPESSIRSPKGPEGSTTALDDMVAYLSGPLILQYTLLHKQPSDGFAKECIEAFLERFTV